MTIKQFIHALLEMLDFRARNLGKVAFCDGETHRAPVLFGGRFVFPICWRCIGVISSMCVTRRVFIKLEFITDAVVLVSVGLLAIVPCALDGVLQYHFGRESNNRRRLTTGLLAGLGIACILQVLRH